VNERAIGGISAGHLDDGVAVEEEHQSRSVRAL
jgi:hypothetical protein